jgi:hypothetical protein
VADWFINVGTFLESMSFLVSQSAYAAGVGHQITIDRIQAVENLSFKNGWSGTIAQDAVCTASLTLRSPTTLPLRPQPVLNINTYKVIDLVSLILVALGPSMAQPQISQRR